MATETIPMSRDIQHLGHCCLGLRWPLCCAKDVIPIFCWDYAGSNCLHGQVELTSLMQLPFQLVLSFLKALWQEFREVNCCYLQLHYPHSLIFGR